MCDQDLLERISIDANVMVGKPVIRGTRLSVEYILNLLAHGQTTEDVLHEYERLSPDDIQACLLFASKCMSDVTFVPADAATR